MEYPGQKKMVGLELFDGDPGQNTPNTQYVVACSTNVHQEFQVPKMEVLNLIYGYFGGGFSLT